MYACVEFHAIQFSFSVLYMTIRKRNGFIVGCCVYILDLKDANVCLSVSVTMMT